MAALTLDVSDTEVVADVVGKSFGLTVSDVGVIGEVFEKVIPSYLDRIYIVDTEYIINVLGVE